MTKKSQIAAMKYVIFHSKEIGDTCKRVLATLLDKSRGLTRPVKIRFVVGKSGFSELSLEKLFTDFSIATSCNR